MGMVGGSGAERIRGETGAYNCRVPSFNLRGPVALGGGSPEGQWGTTLSRSRPCLQWRVAGGPAAFTCPVTPRMTAHTQPEPQLCIHVCVYSQPHTEATSRWIITAPCELTAVPFKTALGPHLPPQAAPRHSVLGPHDALIPHHGAMPRSPVSVGRLTPAFHQNPATRPRHGARPPEQVPALAPSHSTQWVPTAQQHTAQVRPAHLNAARRTPRHPSAPSLCACFFFSCVICPPTLPPSPNTDAQTCHSP